MYRRQSGRRRKVVLNSGEGDYWFEQVVYEDEARAIAADWIRQGAGEVRCHRRARRIWTLTGDPERATA
jgi:hypothetical protein